SLHALHWARRAAALAGSPDPCPATADEAAAHEALLAARNALHAAAGRAQELYVFDLRPAAAAWLGLDGHEAGRRLYTAMRVADRLAWQWARDSRERTTEPRAFARLLVDRLRGARPHPPIPSSSASPAERGGRAG